MNTQLLQNYLIRYGIQGDRPLVAASLERIAQAVVIPALAERSSLFRTLASLAANREEDLGRTLVICVVNNHRRPMASQQELRDNRDTLEILSAIVFRNASSLSRWSDIRPDLQTILTSGLRLSFIDASSPGREIPDREGGVGTARKIGMDAALGIGAGTICCLDADTLVDANYLTAVQTPFAAAGPAAAVVAYAHQMPAAPGLQAAICCYELFLRSYVIGLALAGSPYAFHSIGSTMACTAEGYLGVRGMNRREAAEDFHFLNKIAKQGPIAQITGTTVMPSARISHRVPFGTGRRMMQSSSECGAHYRVHDPRIFAILGKWIEAVEAEPDRDGDALLAESGSLHPRVEEYLRLSRFADAWQRIRRNCRDPRQLRRQFHVWFDGLKTLRLVHHLGRHEFPMIPMFSGMAQLFHLFGLAFPLVSYDHGLPVLDDQYRILALVRSKFPHS